MKHNRLANATKDAASGQLLFPSTRLSNIKAALEAKYGPETGSLIYLGAEKVLGDERSTMDDRGNRVIGNYLRNNILPGYACYRAMLNAGIDQQEAIEFVKGELCTAAERMAKLSRKLRTKKHAYGIFRFFMKIALKFGYPAQGWTKTLIEDSDDRYRFYITSCLYCEELQKRNALELCPAFCYTDVVSYAPLAPAIVFLRKNTLAQTGTTCDFCFERGKIS